MRSLEILKTFKVGIMGLLLMVWAVACQNDHETGPQTAQATITLTAPAEGTMFLANAVVPITGTITAPASMHGYEITLRNKATNVVLFTANGHAHGTSLSFNEQWTNNVSSDAEVEIEVVAILDHDDNKTVKKTTIHCHH
jgi:hypothetical protein